MSETALRRRTSSAIRKWCAAQKMNLLSSLCHVVPRGYVVARIAPRCIVVAVPDCDREPQVRGLSGFITISKFDGELRQGDWCSTAYVSTQGCGESVAIKVVP
jgi:hypothetical protein